MGFAPPPVPAVQASRKPLVELLPARGAALPRRNSKGQTMLEMAQAEGHAEIAAVLAAHSPSIGVK
jgi:ankyrin repeat protein